MWTVLLFFYTVESCLRMANPDFPANTLLLPYIDPTGSTVDPSIPVGTTIVPEEVTTTIVGEIVTTTGAGEVTTTTREGEGTTTTTSEGGEETTTTTERGFGYIFHKRHSHSYHHHNNHGQYHNEYHHS